MTTTAFFTALSAAFTKSPAKAKAVDACFHITVSSLSWTLDCRAPAVASGLRGKPDLTITTDAASFEALVADPSKAMSLYFAGKIKLEGDAMLATRLSKIIDLTK